MVNIEIMKLWCCGFILILFGNKLTSQDFSGHAPGLHWQQLKTEEINIFFPSGIESTANRVYQKIHEFYYKDTSLGQKRFKINMVLQNQTIESNGYVGIGPWMSEFYLTPPHLPYVLGSIDWVEALSIHEYRHVLQGMNSRVGINNALYHLLGEEAWGASYGFVVPDWFAEGDAVNAETQNSNGGRGRMPSFVADFRALQQGKKFWSYDKVRNGSYKNLVPNHYVWGYTMVKYVNDQFGPNLWGNIMNDAVRYKGLLFPFNKSLIRHTGLSATQLYKRAVQAIKADSLDSELNDEVLIKNTKANSVRNYTTPNRLYNGGVLFIEHSFDKLPSLCIKEKNTTSTLTNLGITTNPDYGFVEPLAAWTIVRTDSRWSNRNYSDLVLFNIATKTKRKISNHQKYFNPAPSNDVSMISCMEYLDNGSCNIVVLDTLGKKLHSIPMKPNKLGTYPIFEVGDSTLLSIVRGGGNAAIVRYSLKDYTTQQLTTPIEGIIANITINSDTIYFSSDIDGRDQLYAIIHDKVYQLTHNSIGIQQYSVLGDELLYNFRSSTGIEIRRKKLQDCDYKPVDYFSRKEKSINTLEPYATANKNDLPIATITKASLLNNPFRIYSWSVRPDEGGNVFRILGRNVLNTIDGSIFYGFNNEDRSHSIGGNMDLGIAYPILTTNINSTFGRKINSLSSPKKDSILWDETGLRIGLTVPLRYYAGNQVIGIQPLIQLGSFIPNYKQGERKNYQSTQYIRSFLLLSNRRLLAKQHVSSRLAQTITVQWNRALNHAASATDLNGEFHVPGLSRNHVIELKADFHHQTLSDPYRFANRSEFIGGYRPFSSDYSSWYKISYHLPLLYPDEGINGIYFLKRIRARVFAEQMNHTITRSPKDIKVKYRNLGLETVLDGQLFNVLPTSAGVRLNNPLDTDLLSGRKKTNLEFFIEQLF